MVLSNMSLFWENDSNQVIRKLVPYEATPAYMVFDCGKCGVRINKVWNALDEAYCNNGHLNRRPKP